MKISVVFVFISIYAIITRLFVGFVGNWMELFSISMMTIFPMIIGALTVILAGRRRITHAAKAFGLPWLTSVVVLIVTIMLQLEGAICWIMMFPLFGIFAGIGGLFAYYARKRPDDAVSMGKQEENPNILDDWERGDRLKISLLMLLPLMTGAIEQDHLLSSQTFSITREVVVPAAPEQVWNALIRIDSSDKKPQQRGWFMQIFNLPRHLSTSLDTLAVGGRRIAYYEQGLFFEEQISACESPYRLQVRIKSDPGSVPPNVMDEHIVIGGRYLQALEDEYILTPLPDGTCKVQLRGRVRINTPFNWYSSWWVRWGLRDTFDDLLARIRLNAAAS